MKKSAVLLLNVLLLVISSALHAKPFGETICNDSKYTCYKVKKNDTWKKLFPDETERDLVMRVNRMNTSLYRGLTIAIPVILDSDRLAFSPLPQEIDPPGENLILVSIKNLAFGAYNRNGELEYWGPISTGKGYCPDINKKCNTIRGSFHVLYKKGEDCVSSKFPIGHGGAPMPYCMFFSGNFALHGSYKVPGYNDSHGCVRLFVDDAQWLNEEFTENGKTKVIVQ